MVKYRDNLSEDEREQTPLEDYEDVAAYDCEGVFCGAKLGSKKLEEINLLFIAEVLGATPFESKLSDGECRIEFDEYCSLTDFLSQISGLHLLREVMDTPPTSWVSNIVLIEDASKAKDIISDIDILARALSALQEKAEKASAT